MNRKRAILCLVLLIAVYFTMPSIPAEAQPGTFEYALNVGGLARTFLVHTPAALGPGRPSLVIALHGAAINGRVLEELCGLSATADRHGFIVAYPNGTGIWNRLLTWNSGGCCGYAASRKIDDVAFIAKLIGHMVERFNIDPDRVFVTGVSNGAMMAYRLAAEIPRQIAAIATIAGTLNIEPDRIRSAMPILHFHGTDDHLVPYSGGRGSLIPPLRSMASVEETVNTWVKQNRASSMPIVKEIPAIGNDGTRVVRYIYGTQEDPASVVLYKIVGGGHTWPGGQNMPFFFGTTTTQISANEIMWEFFSAHPRPDRSKTASRRR